MVAPLLPVPLVVRDARLDAAVAELIDRHHPALRAEVGALVAARGDLARHGAALAGAVDQAEAIIGAALAREARVIVPHLRALAGGAPDRALFASVAALAPVLASDQRAAASATATLLVALMVHEATCAACAAAASVTDRLIRALAAHRNFTIATLLPRARIRELALGSVPVR